MRKTPVRNCKNDYITKLKNLYLVNPEIFYAFINHLTKAKHLVGYMDFVNKMGCIKLPKHDKICPALIYHCYYQVFILSNQKKLLNQQSLKKTS